MKLVDEYIKKRKQEVNQDNETEYVKVLDLITTGKPLLEDYTKFLKTRLIQNITK